MLAYVYVCACAYVKMYARVCMHAYLSLLSWKETTDPYDASTRASESADGAVTEGTVASGVVAEEVVAEGVVAAGVVAAGVAADVVSAAEPTGTVTNCSNL